VQKHYDPPGGRRKCCGKRIGRQRDRFAPVPDDHRAREGVVTLGQLIPIQAVNRGHDRGRSGTRFKSVVAVATPDFYGYRTDGLGRTADAPVHTAVDRAGDPVMDHPGRRCRWPD